MWIEDKEGNAYNLDYAYAVKLESLGMNDKSWAVVALLTWRDPAQRPFSPDQKNETVTLLMTDNEQKALDFFKNIKARLCVS